MDLLKENSGGTRILTARHISSEKALPESNIATTNTTLLCEKYSYEPNFQTYLSDLGSYAYVLFPLAAVCVLVLATLFCVTLKKVRNRSKLGRGSVALVLSVYPIVGLCAFMVILLPRVRILAEAVAQQSVMVAMYYFFCFIIAECGGKDQLVRRASGAALETRVLPCCCWPCCVLPRPQLQKKHLTWIGYLVLQMPIIQAIIYLVVLILWAEDTQLYVYWFSWLQPMIAASIMSGVWGIIMAMRAAGGAGAAGATGTAGAMGGAGVAGAAGGAALRPRFLALQLVLIIVKLQSGFTKALPNIIALPCPMNLHPIVLANLIHSCVTLVEMVMLSVVASRLYGNNNKRVERVQHVVIAVLDDSISSEKKNDIV